MSSVVNLSRLFHKPQQIRRSLVLSSLMIIDYLNRYARNDCVCTCHVSGPLEILLSIFWPACLSFSRRVLSAPLRYLFGLGFVKNDCIWCKCLEDFFRRA